MKYALTYTLICAAAVFTGPAMSSSSFLQAGETVSAESAKPTMDAEAFTAALDEIDAKVAKDMPGALEGWKNMLQTAPLSSSQVASVCAKMVDGTLKTGDSAVIADVVETVKETNNPAALANLAVKLASVKNDPYGKDVFEVASVLSFMPSSTEKNAALKTLVEGLCSVNEKYFDLAAESFSAIEQDLTPVQSAECLASLAISGWKTCKNAFASEEMFERLVKVTEDQKQGTEKQEYRKCGDQIIRVLKEYLTLNKDLMQNCLDMAEAVLPEDQLTLFKFGSLGGAALQANDIRTYNAIQEQVLAMPYGKLRADVVTMLIRSADNAKASKLLQAELDNPDITPDEKFQRLGDLRRRCGAVEWYQRGFCDQDAYENWRRLTDEMIALNDSVQGEKPARFDFFRQNAWTAFGYGDFAFAEQQIEKALELNRSESMDRAAMIYLWKKDASKVSSLIAEELKTCEKAEDRLFWRAVDFFNAGGKAAEFDAAFAEDKLDSKAKLLALRRVSELFYRAKRYDVCHDIYQDILNNRFISLKPKSYEVKYVPNAPKTADSFSRTAMYNDWDAMETRFVPYGDTLNISSDIDVKRLLKDAEQPQIDPAWKTGIYVAYDMEGVHIYVRCNDPEIEDVILGERSGGSIECIFRPNDEAPFNMWFFSNLPTAKDDYNVEYASPTPRYRLTGDMFERDACTTPDGIVMHTFIPWIAFYDSLPEDGKVWYLGLQRWCPGGGQTISGQVHELARMLNLKFNISPEQEKEIKRNLCIEAFNRFKNSKTLPIWKGDVELGDPAFYESELAPLVKELNEAGEKLSDADADIDALFKEYMPQWAEFEYTVAEKRRDYLKKKFFE